MLNQFVISDSLEKNGTHGTHVSSGGQMEVIEPEIAGTHGTHGTLVGIDKHTLSRDSDDDDKKGERERVKEEQDDCQVNAKEIEKITDEQKQEQNKDSIIEKIVAQESSEPSETSEQDQQGDNNTIHANNVSHVSQPTPTNTKDGGVYLQVNQHVSQTSHGPLDNKMSDDNDATVMNTKSLSKEAKGSQQITIFNNNNNTKIPNLEPEVHSECLTEALKQQQQNKSFNCFYCSKSHSTNKERITHIDYEHPGKI